jgi:hypothetical protein
VAEAVACSTAGVRRVLSVKGSVTSMAKMRMLAGHREAEHLGQRQRLADAEEVRRRREHFAEFLGADLLNVARRYFAGLHGIHQHQALAIDDLVEQGEPHLSRRLDLDVGLAGEALTHGLHDMQSDGIVGQDVVSQTEHEDFGRRVQREKKKGRRERSVIGYR